MSDLFISINSINDKSAAMFKKVLVALDFSRYTQKMLDRISEIPGIQEVVLLHVVDTTRPARLDWTDGRPHIENPQLLLEEKKRVLEQRGMRVSINVDMIVNAITQNPVSNAILEIAKTENVSLIVIGARGINPIHELLLGSVSSSVIRYATTNVLIMHFPSLTVESKASPAFAYQQLFSKVLVPTDFSRSADDALAFIKTIPGIKETVLLHVVSRAESEKDIEGNLKTAEKRLNDMKNELILTGADIKLHVGAGDPTEMILSVADEDDVSLIAMSAFGLDWIRELVLGSTTFSVVRRTTKPVLIIRTGQENKTG
ncbi:MAG: universal stress protein [Methanoregula sp.]|nr:universal stress protein [Methanoregula sp.]